ncbi:helix-turn-helix domain-containing protein [Clostridium sartagoforme]|nr:helix-turn-helix domain-containing protein [Clostridium sartagoforme]
MYWTAKKYTPYNIFEFDTSNIGGRLRMTRKLFNITLEETSKLTKIGLPTIHEIETSRNDSVSRPTLIKLVDVFPEELILTPYYRFVLRQGEYLKDLDTEFLANLFNLLPSTITRWKKEIYTVNELYYEELHKLGLINNNF